MDNPLQLSLQTFRKGSYIIVEGKQKADYFYIIRNGKVRLSKEVEIVEEVGGNVLSPGDFFGVVSTMSSHRITSYNVCYTKLLRAFPAPSSKGN